MIPIEECFVIMRLFSPGKKYRHLNYVFGYSLFSDRASARSAQSRLRSKCVTVVKLDLAADLRCPKGSRDAGQ